MSYHFHKLRRRRATEAAQKAAEARVNADAAEVKEEPEAKPEAAQKAATSRRKGDA